jgi:hypothetical protein
LLREKVRKCSEDPRNRRKCRGGMNEFTREISLLVHYELMDRLAMRAEVKASLGLICLVWLTRGAINPARFSKSITITLCSMWIIL